MWNFHCSETKRSILIRKRKRDLLERLDLWWPQIQFPPNINLLISDNLDYLANSEDNALYSSSQIKYIYCIVTFSLIKILYAKIERMCLSLLDQLQRNKSQQVWRAKTSWIFEQNNTSLPILLYRQRKRAAWISTRFGKPKLNYKLGKNEKKANKR